MVGRKGRLRIAAMGAPLFGVLLVLVATLSFGPPLKGAMARLDDNFAKGVCRDASGALPLCDFRNWYYPEGAALRHVMVIVSGFRYPAFFAVFMRALAELPYPEAQTVWIALMTAASLCFLLLPSLRELAAPSWQSGAAYGVVLALSMPILTDLAYGNVSSVLTACVLLSAIAYQRRQRTLAAALLALATSVKWYPAMFVAEYVFRRDYKALLVWACLTAFLTIAVPVWVLGIHDGWILERELSLVLLRYSPVMAGSNYIANVVLQWTPRWGGSTGAGYLAGELAGLAVVFLNMRLIWRGLQPGVEGPPLAPTMLTFSAVPFLVRSCWVHYFVFLPVIQLYLWTRAERLGSGFERRFIRASIGASVFLDSALLFQLSGFSNRYYFLGASFWATVALLPALHLTSAPRARSVRPTSAVDLPPVAAISA
jgi:hypothetical protein